MGRVVLFSTRFLAEGDLVAAKVKPEPYKNRGVYPASMHVPFGFEAMHVGPGRVPGVVHRGFRGVRTLLPKAIQSRWSSWRHRTTFCRWRSGPRWYGVFFVRTRSGGTEKTTAAEAGDGSDLVGFCFCVCVVGCPFFFRPYSCPVRDGSRTKEKKL